MAKLNLVPKFRTRKQMVIVISALILVLFIGSAFALKLKAQSRGIPVNTAEVVKDSIQVQVIANGVLEEVNKKEIYTESPLMVRSIEVKEGDEVEKGQVLAILEGDEYILELQKARLNLEQAKLDLKRFKNYGLSEIEAAYNKAKQAFLIAEKSLQNTEKLYNEGAVSQNELELERLKFDEASEALEKAGNAYESSALELKNYENRIALYELGVKEAEKKVEKFGPEVKSPIDGTVTQVNIKEGVFTNPSQPIFMVSDLSLLEVKVNISEYDISKVKLGQEVEITTDALEGETFKGKVNAISPVARVSQIGQSTETVVEVTIGITEKNSRLKPGFSVKSKIIADSKDGCLVLPFDAIITEKNGAKVVFVVEDNVARKREIETGIESDFTVEVTKGVSEGDKVIINPPPSLKDGMKVQLEQKKAVKKD